MPPRLQLLLLLALGLVSCVQALGVLSFDFGSEWLKVGLVKRGVPADMVLNTESKRKTPLALVLNDKERLFGDPAKAAGMRAPSTLYQYLLPLVGQKFDSPVVKRYQEQFPQHTLVATERNTVAFKNSVGTFTVEELVAMVLEYARDMGSEYAEETINDVVITVPPFWGQAERRALMHAADLIGLNVLQLMNDNTAVALSYGVFNQKLFAEKPLNVLFYDQGAGKTTATVVEYQTVRQRTGSKVPQLKIKGMSFDRTLGGLEFDLRVRDHLVKLFEEQKKGKYPVKDNPRAMAKILKEAQRVKEVLSANTETFAQIEGVLPDVDFTRTRVTRAEFEAMCADLFDRAAQPLTDALAAAGMTIGEMDHVIMFGGNQRIPRIQQKLTEVAGGKELAKSINADEAAAIGSVLKAAAHSKGFRVVEFGVEDAVLYPITVTYPRAQNDEEAGGKDITRVLYSTKGKFPEAKLLGFNKHTHDFGFSVAYGDLSFLPKPQLKLLGAKDIARLELTGLTAAMADNANMEYMGTKVRFAMDHSGILVVDSATATFNASVPETLAGLKKDDEQVEDSKETAEEVNADGSEDKKEADKKEDAKKEETKDEKAEEKKDEKAEEKKEGDAKEGDKKDDKKEEKKTKKEEKKEEKPKVKKVDLKLATTHLDLTPLDADGMHASKDRLAKIRAREKERFQAMEAKHKLESSSYAMHDLLDQEGVDKVATQEQLEEVRAFLSEVGDWLYGEGNEATTDLYRTRQDRLRQLTAPIFRRRDEMLGRPAAIEELQKSFKRLEKLNKTPEDKKYFTAEAYEKAAKLVAEYQEWLDKKIAEQEKKALTEEPVLLIADLQLRARRVNREVKALKDTPPPPPPPAPKNDTNATNTTAEGKKEDGKLEKDKEGDKKDEAKKEDETEDNEEITIEEDHSKDEL
eukprot:comp19689_c0_seq2/m.23382 comp19689_c0_seq2/g.23382  ORF comp19689_c0_seq2/g.23382 comp19689_c0_seq2/m.23382 type:complete len:917 (-) comp19689_c0_seq2:482-3232(-)